MSAFIDLTGQTYTRLIVIKRHDALSTTGRIQWQCKCDCGNHVIISGNALRRHNTRSCGCLAHDLTVIRNTTHGKSYAPEYAVWAAMRNRCTNPNDNRYKNYGGRGITLCAKWHSFTGFFADMGNRPTPKHTIERIDNNGAYTLANCRWALAEEQPLNRRMAHLITLYGETLNLAIWARRYHLSVPCILHRLKAGWSIERAITTPSRRQISGK